MKFEQALKSKAEPMSSVKASKNNTSKNSYPKDIKAKDSGLTDQGPTGVDRLRKYRYTSTPSIKSEGK